MNDVFRKSNYNRLFGLSFLIKLSKDGTDQNSNSDYRLVKNILYEINLAQDWGNSIQDCHKWVLNIGFKSMFYKGSIFFNCTYRLLSAFFQNIGLNFIIGKNFRVGGSHPSVSSKIFATKIYFWLPYSWNFEFWWLQS